MYIYLSKVENIIHVLSMGLKWWRPGNPIRYAVRFGTPYSRGRSVRFNDFDEWRRVAEAMLD